jgi:hypothetical protein
LDFGIAFASQTDKKQPKLVTMNFIVIAPPKNPKSAGSMVLYELADELSLAGFKARRVLLTQNGPENFFISLDGQTYLPLLIDTLERHFNPADTVIIHGENLHHKYFDKFNVARYYLNKIGALRNVGVPRQGEFKIAWVTPYVDDPDFLLRRPVIKKPINEPLRLDQPRSIDLTYIGKGQLYDPGLCRLPQTIELTRIWPDNVDEYIYLLSRARFIFSFDVFSSVIEEAIFYGAAPVIVNCHPFEDFKAWGKTAHKTVFNCCCDLSEFEKITDNNIEEYFKKFFAARRDMIEMLNEMEREYRSNLKQLVKAIGKHFGLEHPIQSS